MNFTKVARTTTTISKLIGPCEILSHGQKPILVYAYIYLDRYLIDLLRASEAQRGSKYLYFFSWTLWVREKFYNSIFQIDFEFRDLKIRRHWKHMIMRDEDQQL